MFAVGFATVIAGYVQAAHGCEIGFQHAPCIVFGLDATNWVFGVQFWGPIFLVFFAGPLFLILATVTVVMHLKQQRSGLPQRST